MTREEIKSYLDHGDYVKIARKLSTDRQYVYQVLTDPDKGQRGKGKLILEESEKMAEQNKKDGKQPKKEANNEN